MLSGGGTKVLSIDSPIIQGAGQSLSEACYVSMRRARVRPHCVGGINTSGRWNPQTDRCKAASNFRDRSVRGLCQYMAECGRCPTQWRTGGPSPTAV